MGERHGLLRRGADDIDSSKAGTAVEGHMEEDIDNSVLRFDLDLRPDDRVEVPLLLKECQQTLPVLFDLVGVEGGLWRKVRDLHQTGVRKALRSGKLEDAE